MPFPIARLVSCPRECTGRRLSSLVVSVIITELSGNHLRTQRVVLLTHSMPIEQKHPQHGGREQQRGRRVRCHLVEIAKRVDQVNILRHIECGKHQRERNSAPIVRPLRELMLENSEAKNSHSKNVQAQQTISGHRLGQNVRRRFGVGRRHFVRFEQRRGHNDNVKSFGRDSIAVVMRFVRIERT